jgi:hypothetical protein
MCRGKSHFSQKWPLANVGKSGEFVQHGLANVGESGKSVQHGLANVGKSGEYLPSLKQDRSFYAQITYFICKKQSSLHSLNLPNSPNSPNSHKTCQTCLSRVWRVRAAGLGKCRWVWRVIHISEKGHFGEYSNSPKMANGWRVLEFAKFAGKWPFNLNSLFHWMRPTSFRKRNLLSQSEMIILSVKGTYYNTLKHTKNDNDVPLL